ncbi:MAG TPA: S-layer homology domain-containing protein, partial [Ruminiclostridium sp.]
DAVPTSTAVIMINRMLNTNIKKAISTNADVTLSVSVGLLDDQTNWVYGEPEVAFDFNPTTRKLGSITFAPTIPILRDTTNNAVTPSTKVVGETIFLTDIKDKDVVYEVYNKLNVLMYYLVVDNKIDGQITSILPSKYSPNKIQINDVNYDLGKYAKITKFNSSNGSFEVGDNASVVLGYDGKVVDAYYAEDDNNKDYAFVVNTSTEVSKEAVDYGKVYYTVDLMHVDGTTKTYKTAEDPNQYRRRLVKYSLVNDDTVALLNLSYITASDVQIDRYEKKVGQSYASDNIKIFNYTDSSVSLVKWTDIPDGTLTAGKVQFMGTTGDFGDVNVLLVSDVLDEQNKNCVVQKIVIPDGKRVTEYAYSLISGSNQYTYTSKTEIPGAVVGSVFSMKMYNNTISTFNQIKNPDGLGWFVQAIDSKRVKMNDWVYMYSPDMTVYIKDYSGNLTAKKVADIAIGSSANYGSIKLYCSRPLNNGGKVQAIVISLN